MIVPDASLLLYAYDEASPFHASAADWWCRCLAGPEPVGLLAAVVFAYIRVGTSARVFQSPLSIDEASRHVQSWMAAPATELLAVVRADVDQALTWLRAAGAGGNLTTDAQIAAVAKRCRAQVHTADTDFARFKGVRWTNPILD